MKAQAAVALVLIIVASVAVLAATAIPGAPLHSLATSTPALSNNVGGTGGLLFQVQLAGYVGGGYFVSDYQPNGSSSAITFDVYLWVGNNSCDGNPGWIAGQNYKPSWFQVSVLDPSGSQLPIGSNGPVSFVVSDNNSAANSNFCYKAANGAAGTGGGFFSHTIYLPGNYPDNSVLRVDYFSTGWYCTNTQFTFQYPAACSLGGYTLQGRTTFDVHSWSEAVLHSGYSALYQPIQAEVVNGGQLTVPYSTGWTDGSGFAIAFQYPAVRSNGGQDLARNSVLENAIASTTFTVPQNASVTPPGPCAGSNQYCDWNTFQVVLYSDKFPAAIQRIPVVIYPGASPGIPTITLSDQSGHSPAQQGDSILVSATSSWSTAMQQVTSMTFSGYYDEGESVPPVASSFWINGNTNGAGMTMTANNTSATGTVVFQLTAAAPVTVQIVSCNAAAQCSKSVQTLQVVPDGCTTADCKAGAGFLSVWGPVILAIIVVAATIVVFLFVKVPMIYRVLAIAGEIVLFVIIYTPLSNLFGGGL